MTKLERYAKESEEWQAIKSEMIAASPNGVTAYQVSLEQRKRAMARGEALLTPDELADISDGDVT